MRTIAAILTYTAFMVLMEHLLPWAPLTNAAVATAMLIVIGVAFLAGIFVGERNGEKPPAMPIAPPKANLPNPEVM